MDIEPSFVVAEEDAHYVCGTLHAFDSFYEEFPESPG